MNSKEPSSVRLSRSSIVKIPIAAMVVIATMIAAPAAQATSGLQTQSLSETLSASDLANTLVGPGVTVSNVQYTGATAAAGTFSGGGTGAGSIIGFDQGIVLSSGSIANVVGPNLSPDVTTANGEPGDGSLDALLPAGQSTADAAVLSFDFTANASSISFRYVFSSDEYDEYVNSGYNDVFGFFVNGDSLSADCATVAGQPVSIDTINAGSHADLFRDNDPATIDTEMDGLTTVLLCEAPVAPDQTNTMKLAIADVNDELLDSNVFIEAGSLTTIPPEGTAPTDVIAYPSNGSAIVTWSFSNDPAPADSFEVVCTATGNGDDIVTASVPGSQTNAQVSGLTNGTEYTCAVRAHTGDATGQFSDPSAPFTPSDASIAQFVNTKVGGTVSLMPDESYMGTSGEVLVPRQPKAATLAAVAPAPIIVSASLFGIPGEVDPTCGGNTCVGQGIEWAISSPSAITKFIKVTFFEDPSLVHGMNPKKASVYKDGVLLPRCGKTDGTVTCVSDPDRTPNGGWKITIRAPGTDPRGRV